MKKGKNLPLLRSLIYSLVLFGKIRTTRARAKAVRGLVDKLVNKIKKGTVASKRDVLSVLPQKQIVEKLSREIVPRLLRSSGYTRIVKLGERSGDGAPLVQIGWVTEETEERKETRGTRKRNDKTNKTK